MIHFNQLTPAEAERLALLSEECGEVVQAIGKILRHGYQSTNPRIRYKRITNRLALARELGDVMHAADRLLNAGDISGSDVDVARAKKAKSVEKYLHHQRRS